MLLVMQWMQQYDLLLGHSSGKACVLEHGASGPLPRLTGAVWACLMLQWKERNAAVTAVENVLAGAGGRIQPNVGDLLPALKVCSCFNCMPFFERYSVP